MSAIIEKLFDCHNWAAIESHILYKVFISSSAWGGIVEIGNAEFMLKVAGYNRWITLDPSNIPQGAHQHVATEIAMLWEIKKRIILKNYSPAFVEIVYSKNCPLAKELAEPLDGSPPGSFRSVLARGVRADTEQVAIVVLEKCTETFGRFVPRLIFGEQIVIFKSLLFTLIHGWYVLHQVISDFRHGDTHEGNFMVKLEKTAGLSRESSFNIFYADGKTFAVPYYGIIPKVIDFDHARSESLGIITYTANMQIVNMYANELARLFYELARKLTKSGGRSEFAKKALELLRELNPANNHIENTHTLSEKFPSIKELILSPSFSDYKLSDRVLSRADLEESYPNIKINHIYTPVPVSRVK